MAGTARFRPKSEDNVPRFAYSGPHQLEKIAITEQTLHIAREAQVLHDAIARGDLADATETAVTVILTLEPDGTMSPGITQINSTHIYPER